MLNSCFPSGTLEFGYLLGSLHNQHPIKNLGIESNEFFWWAPFHTCHNPLLEELSMSCVTPLGKNSCKFVPGSPWTWPNEPFSLADFSLYLLTITKHSHESGSTMKCPVLSLPSILSNLRVPGDPQHNMFYKIFKSKIVLCSFS